MAQQPSGAVTSLILAIVGLACCPVAAPFALFRAKNELAEISSGMRPESDRTMALIALILGILGTITLVIYIIIGVVWLIFGSVLGLAILGSGTG